MRDHNDRLRGNGRLIMAYPVIMSSACLVCYQANHSRLTIVSNGDFVNLGLLTILTNLSLRLITHVLIPYLSQQH
ncbi:hypothetical protein F4803DRAFT_528910 [Xylaria telfairii]|nr:hypothetical protein F4803DRAFT_528910 [Xylaria telfairii]